MKELPLDDNTEKNDVRDFWNAASCGEVYAAGDTMADQFTAHERARYALEPYIQTFARFPEAAGKDVLEIGVGMGADHLLLARAQPRHLVGVDLTSRSIGWTWRRLLEEEFTPHLHVADAENLPLTDGSFDLVYSWGVLHHSPNTEAAFAEIHRVLRPGGTARVMIYHSRSIVGAVLWIRYALLARRPRRSLADVYAHHLESPGTKAFTVAEGEALVSTFSKAVVRSQLSFGDLLQGEVGQRHTGRALRLAKRVWPRQALRRFLPGTGLLLLIEATK